MSRQSEFLAACSDPALLQQQQEMVGQLEPPEWRPERRPLRVAGCFVAFARGEAGPGAAGDRAWVGAVIVEGGNVTLSSAVVRARAGATYTPGMLALREGPMVLEALRAVLDQGAGADLLMLDATGRDHPLRCGLALHVGWAIGFPSVGITHRRLRPDRHVPALARRGDTEPVEDRGEVIAEWVCTRDGTRPLVAHAGWRTTPELAVEVALESSTVARTPEPLRRARELARTARAIAGAG